MVNAKTGKASIGWGDCQAIVLSNTIMFDIIVVPAMFIFLQSVAFACEGPLGDDVNHTDVIAFFRAIAKTLIAAENVHCAASAIRLGNALMYSIDVSEKYGFAQNNLSKIIYNAFEQTAICRAHFNTLQTSVSNLLLSMTPQQHFMNASNDSNSNHMTRMRF